MLAKGAVWRSKDPRDNGRKVVVLQVFVDRVVVQGSRKSTIRRARFVEHYEYVPRAKYPSADPDSGSLSEDEERERSDRPR
jgi:hypothetical protein